MKVRQSNYELMRIVSMFFIALHHVIIHGNVFEHTKGGLNFVFAFLVCIALVHVNSFVLVTGYFNCDKKFKWKKFFSVFLQTWFYQVVIVLVLTCFGILEIGGNYKLINALSPLNYSYWFIVCYLLMYLLSPYLNKLINNLNQKEYKKLLILFFVLFSIIPFVTRQVLVANDGFTLVQFIFMYLIGAYFKKYPIKENYHFKKFSKNKLQIILFSGMVFFCLLHFVTYLLSNYFLGFDNMFFHDFGTTLRSYFINYSGPFVILQGICYFLWFGTLSIKSKAINFLASLMFGVYLIHENAYIRPIIYKFLGIDTGKIITDKLIILKVFGAVIVIMVACSLIEFIRIKLFKFIGNRKSIQKLSNKIKNYINAI